MKSKAVLMIFIFGILVVLLLNIGVAKILPYNQIESIELINAAQFNTISIEVDSDSWANKFDKDNLVVTFAALSINWENSNVHDIHFFVKLDDGANEEKFLANSASFEYYSGNLVDSPLIKSITAELRTMDAETSDISDKVYVHLRYGEGGDIEQAYLYFFNQQVDDDVWSTVDSIKAGTINNNFAIITYFQGVGNINEGRSDTSLSCVEEWNCGGWSECIDRQQTRECIDLNSCGTKENKTSENRNCSVAAEKADLVFSSLTWVPENPRANEQMTIYYKIKNTGNILAEDVRIRVGVTCGTSAKIVIKPLTRLEPNRIYNNSFDFMAIAECQGNITGEVDYREEIDELNETNNKMEKTIAVMTTAQNVSNETSFNFIFTPLDLANVGFAISTTNQSIKKSQGAGQIYDTYSTEIYGVIMISVAKENFASELYDGQIALLKGLLPNISVVNTNDFGEKSERLSVLLEGGRTLRYLIILKSNTNIVFQYFIEDEDKIDQLAQIAINRI